MLMISKSLHKSVKLLMELLYKPLSVDKTVYYFYWLRYKEIYTGKVWKEVEQISKKVKLWLEFAYNIIRRGTYFKEEKSTEGEIEKLPKQTLIHSFALSWSWQMGQFSVHLHFFNSQFSLSNFNRKQIRNE